MRLPGIGPTLHEVLRQFPFQRILELGGTAPVQDLIEKANAEYLGWHKFRFLPMPEGVSPQEAWAALKLSRFGDRRQFGLAGPDGTMFSYWLPNAFWGHLHEIEQHGGGEVGMAAPAARGAFRERFLVSSLMEEAIASGQIEGAATTRRVAREMLRAHRRPRNRSEQMILNAYRTITRLRKLADNALTVELLCEIQASMTEGTLDDGSAVGRLRNPSENDIAIYTGETRLHQPPPAEQLPERLDALCAYANRKPDVSGRRFEHPAVRAIMLHFWLGYEHPFVDGNGRTARALFHWYMLKHGYRLFEYLPVSAIIRNSVSQYLRAYWLAERDENDATYFVAYHLKVIRLALRNMKRYLERKQREIDLRVTAVISDVPLNYRQRSLLVHALKHPGAIYTVRSHGTSHSVATQTARNDLSGLHTMRLLEKGREGNRDIWISPNDLEDRLRALGASAGNKPG